MRRPSPATSSRPSSAAWNRRSGWPSSKATPRSCSSRTVAPTGSLLLDAIEAAYVAFRRRLRSIDQATTCDCNSCRLAPRLDLKVFVHHGTFVRSRIAGRDELAGADIIVVHRLLKGAGAATARAQRLRAVHRRRGRRPRSRVRGPAAPGGCRGASSTSAGSTRSRWTSRLAGRRKPDASARHRRARPILAFNLEASFAAEPSVIWAHLTSPALRTRWEGPIRIEETSAGGRRGVGTTAQCVTGRLATLEEIVDWQPYDRVAWRLAVPGVGPVAATADLEPTDGGTRLRLRWADLGCHGRGCSASSGCGARRRPPTGGSQRSSPVRCRSWSRRRLDHEFVGRSRRSRGRRTTSGRMPRTSFDIRSG